jgi:NTE family protein
MIAAKARHHFLETIPIFAGLNAGALAEIVAAVQEMSFRAGDIIVREGESGNRMFIIHSGRVEVVNIFFPNLVRWLNPIEPRI